VRTRSLLLLPLLLIATLAAPTTEGSAGINADGSFYWTGDADVLTAPSDADVVITHVMLSVNAERYRCFAQFPVTLRTEARELWEFRVGTPTVHRYRWVPADPADPADPGLRAPGQPSGLRVPAGSTVTIAANTGDLRYDCDMRPPDHLRVNYAIGGYIAAL